MPAIFRRMNVFVSGCIVLGALLMLGGCSKKNGGGGGGGGGGDTPCTTAASCTGAQVCDPTTETCVDTLACAAHADCGSAAYCNTAASVCVRSAVDQGNPCAGDANCAGSETCTEAGRCGCGGVHQESTRMAPNLLIVFDRSTSMNYNLDGTDDTPPSGESRWEIALNAVDTLTSNPEFDDEIRFGLALYPGTTATICTNKTPGRLIVPPSDDASAIMTALNDSPQCMYTPIGATLDALRTTYATEWQDPARPNHILLITDGAENMNKEETDPLYPVTQAGHFHSQAPPVNTYVIGFNGVPAGCDNENLCINPTLLDAIAEAGGTTAFHPATDLGTLNEAFTTIAGSAALSCSYGLGDPPPPADSIDKLHVFLTTGSTYSEVPRDTTRTNGWDYDSSTNQVIFYGTACDTLNNGTTDDVSVVYGCATEDVIMGG